MTTMLFSRKVWIITFTSLNYC